jgi:putative NADPH-quinone reductase
MTKKILVLNLHPAAVSLNDGLAGAYVDGAVAAGNMVERINLHDLRFDVDFGQAGFRGAKPLEPDLEAVMAAILRAEHLVLVTPMWWGGLPAKAKGLFDRAFLPGRAFDPRKRRMGLPIPLLAGRTGRLILTSDTPGWAFWSMYGAALRRQVKGQILSYVGIRPMGFSHFTPVEHSTPGIREGWLAKTRALGQAAR